MTWLNYHHLLYFWTVAREGSVVRAAAALNLTQPTISGQLRSLERALGERLFHKAGRGLELTEVGRLAFQYADEIFALGRELLDTLDDRPTGRPLRLVVGVADVVPKLFAARLLRGALRVEPGVHLVCREDKADRLLAQLSMRELDVVLADVPMGPNVRVKAFSHLLGECDVTWCATRGLAGPLRRGFPASLDGAPVLLPTANTALRLSLDHWFDRIGVRPRIIGEFEDSALMKAVGQGGVGAFPVPTAVAADVRRQFRVVAIARVADVRERLYAISVEKKLEHPAVVALSRAARSIFAPAGR
ncbi:MAG: transcriptional activator NhaR [Vicinamibacterales bacterium]